MTTKGLRPRNRGTPALPASECKKKGESCYYKTSFFMEEQ
jgi:hypothetical protein